MTTENEVRKEDMLKSARKPIQMIGKLHKLQALRRRMSSMLDNFGLEETGLIAFLDQRIADLTSQLQQAEAPDYSGMEDLRQLLSSSLSLPQSLIQARLLLGWSQSQLGKRIGMTRQQVSHYERNQYSAMSLSRCLKVADALKQAMTEIEQ